MRRDQAEVVSTSSPTLIELFTSTISQPFYQDYVIEEDVPEEVIEGVSREPAMELHVEQSFNTKEDEEVKKMKMKMA